MSRLSGASLQTLMAALRELQAGQPLRARECLRDLTYAELDPAATLLLGLLAEVDEVRKARDRHPKPRRQVDDYALPSAVAQVMGPQPQSGGGWISGSCTDAT